MNFPLNEEDSQEMLMLFPLPNKAALMAIWPNLVSIEVGVIRARFEEDCLEIYAEAGEPYGEDVDEISRWFAEHPDQVPPTQMKGIQFASGNKLVFAYEGVTYYTGEETSDG